MPVDATCEDHIRLDLAEPSVRAALDLARSATGVIRWTEVGADIAAVGYDWRHVGRRLILNATIDGVATSQIIAITTTQPHFGGVRLWFVCPESGQRARVLWLAREKRLWVGRAALGAAYASQYLGVVERRLRRVIEAGACGARRNAMRCMLRRRQLARSMQR